ncbi:MAG: bifunctional phosphoglucose/phosphomannose isomerase [Candidatus Omnitrophota bacterium]
MLSTKILDNIKKIRALDKSGMLESLNGFPRQCLDALDLAKRINLKVNLKGINKIIFAGLGGSAIGADLVKSFLIKEASLPIIVIRDYWLPEYIDKNSLVFVNSYSGNTEETLSTYCQARKKKAKVIVICSGGKLLGMAKHDRIPYVVIPSGFLPRAALAYSSIVPLVILSKAGLVKDKTSQIKEMAKAMERLRNNSLNIKISQDKNIAKIIANKLFGKFVIIYGAAGIVEAVVTRFRGQLAENSKILSFSHLFPEMNHNEIVGWQNPRPLFKNLAVVFLRDKDDHKRTKIRMDITREIIKKEGADVIQIHCKVHSLISKIFYLVYICDFISFYLAILNGVDPTPVDKVTYLKRQLAKFK